MTSSWTGHVSPKCNDKRPWKRQKRRHREGKKACGDEAEAGGAPLGAMGTGGGRKDPAWSLPGAAQPCPQLDLRLRLLEHQENKFLLFSATEFAVVVAGAPGHPDTQCIRNPGAVPWDAA